MANDPSPEPPMSFERGEAYELEPSNQLIVKFVLPATPVVGSVAVTVIVPTGLPEVLVRTPELSMLTPAAVDGLKLQVTEFVITTC